MTTGLTGGLFMFKDLYTTPGKKCSSSLVSFEIFNNPPCL